MIREVWSRWGSEGPHGDTVERNTGGWEDDGWRERDTVVRMRRGHADATGRPPSRSDYSDSQKSWTDMRGKSLIRFWTLFVCLSEQNIIWVSDFCVNNFKKTFLIIYSVTWKNSLLLFQDFFFWGLTTFRYLKFKWKISSSSSEENNIRWNDLVKLITLQRVNNLSWCSAECLNKDFTLKAEKEQNDK